MWKIPSNQLCKHLGVISEIDVALLTTLLWGFNPSKYAFVIAGLNEGFRLGLGSFGPFPPRPWIESFVAPASRSRITAYLTDEVAACRMFGPFDSILVSFFWDRMNVFPMGEVWRSDGRYRTITNFSVEGPANSINGFILDSASDGVPFVSASRRELRHCRFRCGLGRFIRCPGSVS